MNWTDPYLISDTHLFHEKILNYVPRRIKYYGDFDNMNRKMIHDWNSTVSQDDVVIHVGDMIFYKEEALSELNGFKVLVIGNHDRSWKRLLKKGLINMAMHGMDINLLGESFRIQHHPEENWHGKDDGSILLHGHEHGDGTIMRYNALDVGIDLPYMFHRPQKLSTLLGVIRKRNAQIIKAESVLGE